MLQIIPRNSGAPNRYPSSWRRLRPIAYKTCVELHGELCTDCHKRPVKPGQSISDEASQCKCLDVDHVDNNKANNPKDGSNWALRCHKCNCKKITDRTPRGPKFQKHIHFGLSLKSNNQIAEGGLKIQFMEMAKNLQAQPMFDLFTDEQLREKKSIKKRLLLSAGARDYKLKTTSPSNPDGNRITQQTLARYLEERLNDINGDLEDYTDPEGDSAIKARV